MENLDSYFSERAHELGLNVSELHRQGVIPQNLRSFITAIESPKNMPEENLPLLCEVLKIEPETALRHIRITSRDWNLRERYPDHYERYECRNRRRKPHISRIESLVREARRCSKSYGEYVGMLYLEQEQSVMDRWIEYKLRRAIEGLSEQEN